MTSVGRRPTLYELLEALHAVVNIEADMDALDSKKETFRVVLTFQRAQCPGDWQTGQPKPSWLFDQIMEELSAWLQQRNREAQWVSKEEQFGASIDTLMAHWTEELKKNAGIKPENMLTRATKQILSNTILRLKELKERREAGAVYSATENRREKARKAWMEDEFEAPNREEQQRREQAARDFVGGFWDQAFEQEFDADFFSFDMGAKQKQNRRKAPPLGKKPWWVTLGVDSTATDAEVEKAYRRLVAKHQPRTNAQAEDRTRTERMAEINTARDECRRLRGL